MIISVMRDDITSSLILEYKFISLLDLAVPRAIILGLSIFIAGEVPASSSADRFDT